jgi:outer membrane protein OmpA-like peptidoglycan-associated protein
MIRTIRKTLCALLLAPLVTIGVTTVTTAAEPPGDVVSQSQIEAALVKPRTRGLVIRATTEGRDAQVPVKSQSQSQPAAVNLTIPFEYNSAELRPEAVQQLIQLEAALRADSLQRFRFLVAGHTDARGDPRYNRELSQRRAEAVRRFLVAAGISAERLDAVGLGEDRLLLPQQPDDARNRRVEIRNLGEMQ